MPSELVELPIADIRIGERSRKVAKNLESLVASIEKVGLLHPPVVTTDNLLVAGFRRIKAYEAMGRTVIPVHRVSNLNDAADLIRAEKDENDSREALTPEEQVDMAHRLKEIEAPLAAERKREGQRRGALIREAKKRGESILPDNVRQDASGEARQIIAEAVGTSTATLSRATQVVTAARAEPEKYGDILDEMNRTGNATGALAKLNARRDIAPVELPPPPAAAADADKPAVEVAFDDRAEVARHASKLNRNLHHKAIAAFIDAVKAAQQTLAESAAHAGAFGQLCKPLLTQATELRAAAAALRRPNRCAKCDRVGCPECQRTGWLPETA